MTPLALWAGGADRDLGIGPLSETWAAEIARDPYLRQEVMVVELVLGSGLRLRAATEILESVATDGTSRWVAPVLREQPEIEEDYDLGIGNAPSRALRFVLPSWWLQPYEQLRLGAPIAAFAEVSLMVDGMPWEQRHVIMRGNVQGGIQYVPPRARFSTRDGYTDLRDSGEVSIEVADPRDSCDAVFPPHVVDADRWPDASAFGTAYPMVYGGSDVLAPKVSSSNSGTVLAAYGHGFTVQEVFRDGVAALSYTAEETVDGMGVPVTVVHTLNGAALADGERVIVRLTEDADPEPTLIRVIRRIVEEFAPDGPLLVAGPLFAAALARLPHMPMRCQCNTRTTLFRYIEEGILDDFPMVSMVWEGGRYGPIVTDYRSDPVAALEVGDGVVLDAVGDPVVDQGSALNSFLLRYAWDGPTDSFLGVLLTDASTDRMCAISEDQQGPRPAPEVQSVQIATAAAAGIVQDWRVHHQTLPTVYREYAVVPGLRKLVRRGDTLLFTDPDHPWTSVRATLERYQYLRGRLIAGLRIWSHRYRDGVTE